MSPNAALPPPDLAMLHAILDHIPGRVIVIGTDHRYLYVNREFLDFMQLEPEQALGRHVSELLGEEIYKSFEPVAQLRRRSAMAGLRARAGPCE